MNLLNGYEKLNSILPSQKTWTALRETGFSQFQKKGIPTRNLEEWKYTSLKPILDIQPYTSIANAVKGSSATEEAFKNEIHSDYLNITFINGFLNAKLSQLDKLVKGLEIADLQNSKFSFEETISFFQAQLSSLDDLNNAFSGQGVTVNIDENLALSKPIKINFFTSIEKGLPVACHPKIFIKIGKFSKADIYLNFKGLKNERYFNNSNIYLNLEESANLQFIYLQNETSESAHTSHLFSRLNKNSHLNVLNVSLGSKLSRFNLDVVHKEKGSSSQIDGIYVVEKDQHIDHHTCIDHQIGECQSLQTYKGILNDNAHAVFNGKVKIQKGADLANSQQVNQNLLLSSTAEIDTKPELEIFADNVKATHGATVGQISEEEIFYLQSRAISRKEAIRFLSSGFVSELAYQIRNENFKKEIMQKIETKLNGGEA